VTLNSPIIFPSYGGGSSYLIGVSKEIAISCVDLHRSYKIGKSIVEILKGIDLEVYKGEKVFLCGSSGAGKTTLMYSMAGLEKPKQGEVIIEGTNLYKLGRGRQANFRNEKLGYIFQNYFLLPELTAQENVMIPGMIARKDVKDRAMELLEIVGLDKRAAHLPAELSGGEQQRVAIARALINNPSILFADEPTGNLDSENGNEVMRLLFEMSEKTQTTLVMVTHDTELAKTGDRTVFIKDGVVQ